MTTPSLTTIKKEKPMKKFVAELNDGSFINIYADKMELVGNFLYAWERENLVAVIDISVLLMAKLDDTTTAKR